jgi:hypothetical protein
MDNEFYFRTGEGSTSLEECQTYTLVDLPSTRIVQGFTHRNDNEPLAGQLVVQELQDVHARRGYRAYILSGQGVQAKVRAGGCRNYEALS